MDIDEAFDGINNLKEWKLDKRVKQRIKDSGFDGLLRLTTFPVNHDLPLLSALVESYDVKSRCFVFNGYKLVFGLEDVLYITGLPVDGNPVTGIDSKGNELCMKYLGRNVCDKTRKGLTNSAWLRNNFEVVPETIDQDSPEIEPYVRAFLLYLIGSIVVPSYHGTNVPVMYLSLMENLQSIKDYAWGAALLAHLHISMENFKQPYSPRRRNILIGHSYSLMVFAMERIPKLLLRFCLNGANPVDDYLPTTFPLLAGWTKLLSEPSNAEEKITKQEYLQILDGLKEDDIVWQPYKRLPCDFLPQYCAGQEKIGMSRTILLCYEKAVYHRPDLSPKQFGIQEVNTNMLRPLVELELSSRFGRKGKNWGTYGKYGCYKEEWESRASCLIIESAEEDPGPPSFEALTTLSSQTPNDPGPQSAKRKTLDHVGDKLKVKTKKTSGILVDTYGPTNSLPSWNAMHPEPQLVPSIESRSFDPIDVAPLDATQPPSIGVFPIDVVPSIESRSFDPIDVAPLDATQPPSIGVFPVESNQEEPATICPSNSSSSLLINHFHSELFSTAGSHKLLDELSSLEADVIDLLRGSVTHHSDVWPTTMQAPVESAKETIRGILCRGFDALTNSEMQEAFFASSEVLLSADVFPCAHLKTRLTVFRNELRENATAFLQAQTAIDIASEFSSLQEFLEVQAVKIPALQERLGVAAKKIAHLRAILDAAVERQTKMDKVLASFVDKTKIAKQKLASLNPQAADIESKKQAAVKVVEQCKSSWVDLSTSLFRFL